MSERTIHEALRTAVGYSVLAPSEHNAQPWLWRLHDEVLDLHADRTRRLPSTDRHARGMLIGCGCALHHLRVALAVDGLDAVVRHGNDVDDEHPLARVRVAIPTRSGTPDARTLRWFAAMPTRRTDRRRFSGRDVPPGTTDRLMEAARDHGGSLHLVVGHGREVVTEAAREADRRQLARLDYGGELQRWTHRLAGAHDGIPAASRPGSPSPTYGNLGVRWMPPGTLALPRTGLDPHDASLLLLLAAPADDTVSLVRAGEALSAVLLEAASIGLSVTPFNHPLEVDDTRERIRRTALGLHQVPVIAMRVGWPVPRSPVIPPTPRRGVHSVLTEEP